MIKAVEVINHSGELFRCILDNPEESGYALVGMEGIVPGKGTINVKEIATLDGGYFLNSRLSSRNIVLTYIFLDYYLGVYRTIEEARLQFYKYFVVKKPLTIVIETDTHRYRISGYVESNEPDIFSTMEGAQVSIICPNPYFRLADDDLNENGNLSEQIFNPGGSFSFPFSNRSFRREIQFGDTNSIQRESTVSLYYEGDIDTGVIFHIFVTGDATQCSYIDFDYLGNSVDNPVQTTLRFNNLRFRQNSGLQVGDELIISTIPGDKYAIVKREESTINVLYCVDLLSDWIYLQKGNNVIHVDPKVVNPYPANFYIDLEYPILFAGV